MQHDALAQMQAEATSAVEAAGDLASLKAVKHVYFSKKNGQMMAFLKNMRDYDTSMRQAVHATRSTLVALFEAKETELQAKGLEEQLRSETVDVSLPGRQGSVGRWHLITQQKQRITAILNRLNFEVEVKDGFEIENAHYNFTALNIPANHPARTLHDTFYIDAGSQADSDTDAALLLRTHTSNVQIHSMSQQKPPFRIASMGRVYRCDFDPTHTPMFHQLEGLWVDERVHFADLKGLLHLFLQLFFDTDALTLRFRPAYFPFTEPSAEVDMRCHQCEGRGCRLCSQTGWIEMLGCGMVHPNVLRGMDIDTERYTGCAFGVGIDRLAMLRHGVDDLRRLFENDWRFLGQFI